MLDYEKHYLLREAFERTGHAIYGDAWRGAEADAEEPADLSPIVKRRGEIEKRLLAIRRINKALHKENKDASEVERAQITVESVELWAERGELMRELNELPKAGEISETRKATFERRMAVEKKLWAVLRKGDLDLYADGSSHIDVQDHERHAGFSVSFQFSLIRRPSNLSRRRHAIASLSKLSLNKWLRESFGDMGHMSASSETDCQLWMQGEILSPKSGNKDDYRIRAMSLFKGLSNRAFDRIWGETVPKDWSKSGPLRPR